MTQIFIKRIFLIFAHPLLGVIVADDFHGMYFKTSNNHAKYHCVPASYSITIPLLTIPFTQTRTYRSNCRVGSTHSNLSVATLPLSSFASIRVFILAQVSSLCECFFSLVIFTVGFSPHGAPATTAVLWHPLPPNLSIFPVEHHPAHTIPCTSTLNFSRRLTPLHLSVSHRLLHKRPQPLSVWCWLFYRPAVFAF